jgi:hypothetical protein
MTDVADEPLLYLGAGPRSSSALPPTNPHWNPVDDTQSYAFRIYRKIYDKLANDAFFANFVKKRTNKALPIEGGVQIPFLGVHLLPEKMTPDGDINVGPISFKSNVRVGIQIVIASNDYVQMEADLDRIYWYVMHNILDDGDFTNLWKSNIPGDNPRIEGFQGITKTTRWGSTGAKNEIPVGELQIDISMLCGRPYWRPWDFPDLNLLVITTSYPPGADPNEIQQVKIVAAFDDTGYVSPPYDPTAPVNTDIPQLSGTAQVGQTLSCSTGTWTGFTPIDYTYQWFGGVDRTEIAGATANTLLLAGAQVGFAVWCSVTATNVVGPSTADSQDSAVVSA